jgi:hypothetical protein
VQDSLMRVPTNGDVERPNTARLYDYYLGGAHNFAVDRELGEQSVKLFPADEICRASRSFLRRVVRLCVASGIRQFLDLGSGIPTAGNVHEVAQLANPDCRVVYVDNESVAVAHSRTMLKGNAGAAVVEADVREPETVLNAPATRALLDFDEPVALLMIGILPYLADCDRPCEVIARYRWALVPGSFIAMTHLTADVEPDMVAILLDLAGLTPHPVVARSKNQVADLLDGLDLMEPGLVPAARWRSDGEVAGPTAAVEWVSYGAVGRVAGP